jgi:hypothetical protein
MITGRGTSLFSIHFVSSFPKKVIPESPVGFWYCPWLLRVGKEKVIEARRHKLEILMNLYIMV